MVRGLRVFFEQVRKHARAYKTLLRGGLGADDELLMVVERTRQEFLSRIVERLTDRPTPLQRTAVRGWLGCVEAASMRMLAPAQNTRSLPLVTITTLTLGCSNRIRCMALLDSFQALFILLQPTC